MSTGPLEQAFSLTGWVCPVASWEPRRRGHTPYEQCRTNLHLRASGRVTQLQVTDLAIACTGGTRLATGYSNLIAVGAAT